MTRDRQAARSATARDGICDDNGDLTGLRGGGGADGGDHFVGDVCDLQRLAAERSGGGADEAGAVERDLKSAGCQRAGCDGRKSGNRICQRDDGTAGFGRVHDAGGGDSDAAQADYIVGSDVIAVAVDAAKGGISIRNVIHSPSDLEVCGASDRGQELRGVSGTNRYGFRRDDNDDIRSGDDLSHDGRRSGGNGIGIA